MNMRMLSGLVAAFAIGACALRPPARADGQRIVSIDYCADQMLLGLVPRARIAGVSVDVDSDPSFAGPRAIGLPRVRAEVERIIALRPTLVVRSYGGGPRIAAMLERAGVDVHTLPYANSIAAVRTNMVAAGAALDAEAAARNRVATLDAAIAAANVRRGDAGTALYMTPGDVTTGPGGLVADVLLHAGYRPYETHGGWHRLPVERLMRDTPDLIFRAFFESPAHQQDRWSSARHAVVAKRLRNVPTVTVPGATMACGNWLVADALTAVAGARQ